MQPVETKPALCPNCGRHLQLVKRLPVDMTETELRSLGFDGKPGDLDEVRMIFRSDDMGAALLWVRKGDGWEEIMRESASGGGPDGDAHGDVECDECGTLEIDALCARYEAEE